MFNRSVVIAVVVTIAFAVQTAQAAQEIGEVRVVKGFVYGTPPGASRGPLYRWDDVFADEVVETIKDAGLHVRFLDNTKLRIGSSSRVTLDSFVYNRDTSAGEMVVDLGEGVFRFITGKLNKEGFQVRTPVAVIGVRGTDFVVRVGADGTTTVSVNEGLIEVTALGGGGASAGVGVAQAATVSVAGLITIGPVPSLGDPALEGDFGPDKAGTGGGNDGGSSG